jgi:hypothetical protein
MERMRRSFNSTRAAICASLLLIAGAYFVHSFSVFQSVELTFTDTTAKGLAIVPASCASAAGGMPVSKWFMLSDLRGGCHAPRPGCHDNFAVLCQRLGYRKVEYR